MIALDSSAIVAILLDEAEGDAFQRLVVSERTIVGAPTLVETRLVLEGRLSARAEATLRGFLARPNLTIVPFDTPMFEAAIEDFARFGKGRRPAKPNFGDCLSYAVARTQGAPLLFKGLGVTQADLAPAYRPDQ